MSRREEPAPVHRIAGRADEHVSDPLATISNALTAWPAAAVFTFLLGCLTVLMLVTGKPAQGVYVALGLTGCAAVVSVGEAIRDAFGDRRRDQ